MAAGFPVCHPPHVFYRRRGHEDEETGEAAQHEPPSDQVGEKDGGALPAGWRALGRRLAAGVRRPLRPAGGGRHFRPAGREEVAGLFSRALRSERRRPRRGPDLHLQPVAGRRRAHQQLGGTLRDEEDPARSFPRLHAGPHDVRAALLHGSAGLAHVADRRRTHRLGATWSSTCASWRASAGRSSSSSTGATGGSCPACIPWARR